MNATVRVMRSYDYNHFEATLTDECADLDAVNNLRKQAAILVDEAIRQYIIAKAKESDRMRRQLEIDRALAQVETIKKNIPETERTPEQAALVKAAADKSFWDDWARDEYAYNDGYEAEREEHFSMLAMFKRHLVKG